MSPTSPIRNRESFDGVAEEYDRYRSGYPDDVNQYILTVSKIRNGTHVLEIGCGTGQLSVSLAARGADLVAVELGPNLAERARRNLARFPNTQVEIGDFELWPLPDRRFDAVVSANAFHWIDPEVRFTKTAAALAPGGVLTIAHAHHVRGGTPGFFEATQPYYVRWGLSDDPFFQPTTAADAPLMYPEVDLQPEFRFVDRHRFEIPRHHTAETYVGWLKTDSLVSSLDIQARQGFLSDIEQLIRTNYDGAVSRNFVYEVISAQRIG